MKYFNSRNINSKIMALMIALILIPAIAHASQYFVVFNAPGANFPPPPPPPPSPECYDPVNARKVGTWQGCDGLLIVENGITTYGIHTAVNDGITVSGTTYDATSIFTGQVTAMNNLFSGQEGMFDTLNTFNENIDFWDTSNVVSMDGMFSVSTFNQPIGSWDTSSVTSMKSMFYKAKNFNQPIESWDVSSVTDMSRTFGRASAFNQDISEWEVGSVTTMWEMFKFASAFDKPLPWDTSSVTDMNGMLSFTSFNQPIDSWITSSVTDMGSMFWGSDFDYPIGSWDVRNVTNMSRMFQKTSAFNQDLSGWCVTEITSQPSYFDYEASNWSLPRPPWGGCP